MLKLATQPNVLKMAWAKNGAKATIPETTSTLGVASLSQGFPVETELPIDDGGVPPRRVDFNGAFYMLSMFAMYQQAGGQFLWSAQVDYDLPSIIYHNGDLWWCLQSNGVSSTIVEPGTNSAYWIKFKSYVSSPLDAYPVGSYYISSNSVSPAVLFGGTWEQIQDRMILAAGSTYTAGNTGGSAKKTLEVANLPSHNHSCNATGSHTHTYYTPQRMNDADRGVNNHSTWSIDSSGTYTSSSSGDHSHTIGSTGNNSAFDIMPPYIVAYVWRRTA